MGSIVCFYNFLNLSVFEESWDISVVSFEKQTCLVHSQTSRIGLALAESGCWVFDSALFTLGGGSFQHCCSWQQESLELFHQQPDLFHLLCLPKCGWTVLAHCPACWPLSTPGLFGSGFWSVGEHLPSTCICDLSWCLTFNNHLKNPTLSLQVQWCCCDLGVCRELEANTASSLYQINARKPHCVVNQLMSHAVRED